MRTARPDLKVLYVAGNVSALFEARPLLFDGEAFLGKPYTKTGLLEAVSLLRWGTLSGAPPPPPTTSGLRVRWRGLLGRGGQADT